MDSLLLLELKQRFIDYWSPTPIPIYKVLLPRLWPALFLFFSSSTLTVWRSTCWSISQDEKDWLHSGRLSRDCEWISVLLYLHCTKCKWEINPIMWILGIGVKQFYYVPLICHRESLSAVEQPSEPAFLQYVHYSHFFFNCNHSLPLRFDESF